MDTYFVVMLSQFSPQAEANIKAITVAQSLDILLLLLISRTLAHSWCAEGLLGGPSSSDHWKLINTVWFQTGWNLPDQVVATARFPDKSEHAAQLQQEPVRFYATEGAHHVVMLHDSLINSYTRAELTRTKT